MHGPFCHKTWSVLSLTWSVLSCGGPFCPWSVLSMVRYVHNSVQPWVRFVEPVEIIDTKLCLFRVNSFPRIRRYMYLFFSAN